jgi:hypothetical protein
MFFRPTIEVEDGPAFLTLAKDLKPIGRLIVFEPGGRYRFMTRQGDDVMSVSYTPPSVYPSSNPQGQVTHNIPIRPPYNAPLGWAEIYRKLGVTTRLKMRDKTISKGIKQVLASSSAARMRWTSSNKQIKNVRVIIHNIGVTPHITLQYVDTHVRELSRMLDRAGFKVVNGKITH